MSNAAHRYLFTSESVTEGHPDKVADQISDGILDEVLKHDPAGRVACEAILTTGIAFVAGEITTKHKFEYADVVRDVVRGIGYTNAAYGFDADSCAVVTAIHQQSGDIAMGVDTGGAGDQGLMFGYACDETEELMPLPIMLAHKLTRRLADCRKDKTLPFLRPDGKSQVTVEYEGDRPVKIHTVVISAQHDEMNMKELQAKIIECVIKPVLPPEMCNDKIIFHVNPTGRFVIGGPHGDTGLTGRKIIVDTYGGAGHHGGGCFSGKDPSKVDRSASYMARYIAKNLIAAGIARRAEVQLAYAIGVAEPVSVMVNTFGTSEIDEAQVSDLVRANFNLKPRGIIDHLKLRRPVYRKTAAYGHFGRTEPEFTWELVDKAAQLRSQVGLASAAK